MRETQPQSFDPKLWRMLGWSIAFFCGSLTLALVFQSNPRGHPLPPLTNVFNVLFARNEPLGVAVGLIFLLMLAVGLKKRWFDRPWPGAGVMVSHSKRTIVITSILIFVICFIGRFLVMHRFSLAMDEYASDFQAQIFLSGHLQAHLPPAWAPFGKALTPFFIAFDPGAQEWHSTYLPVYAAFRAIFLALGAIDLTNAVFSAGSVLAIAGVARRIWPGEPLARVAAVLLLATAPVFLVTGMTAYAMPAHLCLNLIWLWLYLQPEKRRFWFAPLVGILALGLHQPFFHALFASPFLLRLVLQRRWRAVAAYASIYLAGIACWFAWWKLEMPNFSESSGGVFRFWDSNTPLREGLSLVLLFSWQNALTLFLVLFALSRIRKLPVIIQDAAWGILLTAVFYSFVAFSQGHGWGNRYLFNVLGNLVLLAVTGLVELADVWDSQKAFRLLFAGALYAVAVQLPLRCVQAEDFVRPFARAMDHVRQQKAAVVIIDHIEAWYSSDLVRNDPFLDNTPKIMMLRRLQPDQLDFLLKQTSVKFVHGTELATLGLVPTDPRILKKFTAKSQQPESVVRSETPFDDEKPSPGADNK